MKKKIISLFLALSIILITFHVPACAKNTDPAGEQIGSVTMSVEAFTLGLGYIVEPVIVPLYKNDNAAILLARLLDSRNIAYQNTGTINEGFYLAQMQFDGSDINPPDYLMKEIPQEQFDKNDLTDKGYLGEFCYTNMSGWMFSMNNWFPNLGSASCKTDSLGAYRVNDGDVIRWQFTLWGYGMDLGGGFEGDATSGSFEGTYVSIEDRTAATQILGEINTNHSEWMNKPGNKEIYDIAVNAISNMVINRDELASAIQPLYDVVGDPYNIFVSKKIQANGHSVTTNLKKAKQGEVVSVTALPKDDKFKLDPKLLTANAIPMMPTDKPNIFTFVMPKGNVQIHAGFVSAIPMDRYNLGDINNNGVVDSADATTLLSNFGKKTSDQSLGDVNNNGVIDSDDLTILLSNFGKVDSN